MNTYSDHLKILTGFVFIKYNNKPLLIYELMLYYIDTYLSNVNLSILHT